MTINIKIGQDYIFNYPPHFTAYPDYTVHTGQQVTVIRELRDPEEYNGPKSDPDAGERMFRIQALEDGWTGDAFESELSITDADGHVLPWRLED